MKKEINTILKKWDTKEPYTFVLEDKVEGNMTFHFCLKINNSVPHCYSTFQAKSPSEGMIDIYNAPLNKQISVKEDMYVGTFEGKYSLFLNYLFVYRGNEVSSLVINFLVEEK